MTLTNKLTRIWLGLLIVMTLSSSGCQSAMGTRVQMKEFLPPEQPEIAWRDEGNRLSLTESELRELNQYVIKLDGALKQCNSQARTFSAEK